jgi:hypothetical protein
VRINPNIPEPSGGTRVVRHKADQSTEALLDDRYAAAGYLKDSHDLELVGGVSYAGFGIVRQHAADGDGRLWLVSDHHLAVVTDEGVQIVEKGRFPEELRGLVVSGDSVWCGKGKSLRSFSLDGTPRVNVPLDFRVSKVHELGAGRVGAESDYLAAKLAVVQDGQVLAQGENVVSGTLQKGAGESFGWLEKTHLVRGDGQNLTRTPVAERPAAYWPTSDGGFLLKHAAPRGDKLSRYDANGDVQGQFSFGRGGYVREVVVQGDEAFVASDRNGKQRVEKLSLDSGWLASMTGWNRTVTLTQPRQNSRPLLAADGTVSAPSAGSLAAVTESWDNGKVTPGYFRFQPAQGKGQLRCAPLGEKFVTAGMLAGAAGAVLAAATDGGTLLVGSDAGLRGYRLGAPVVASEIAPHGMLLRLGNGETVEVQGA